MNKIIRISIEIGKKIDTAIKILGLILAGILLGYTWASCALN